jgi:3-hydroxyisobutyrate dehydrogenase and related beta-hydroxyacid dehydrogenases
MALKLASAGFEVAGWDREEAALANAAGKGIARSGSVREAVEDADCVFLCLPDSDVTQAMLFGEDGVARLMTPERMVVDHSTAHPDVVRSLARRLRDSHGIDYIDAPVSVSPLESGGSRRTAWVGGDDATIQRALPWLETYVDRVVPMGQVGAGQFAKSCNQAVVCATVAAWGEMLEYARDYGIDPAAVTQALNGAASDSVVARQFSGQLERHALPELSRRNFAKDLRIVLDVAQRSGTPMPICTEALRSIED